MQELSRPVNAEERFLYGIVERLDVLIMLFDAFVKSYTVKQENAPVKNTATRKKKKGDADE